MQLLMPQQDTLHTIYYLVLTPSYQLIFCCQMTMKIKQIIVSGLLYTRIVWRKPTSEPRTSSKQKLFSASSSLITTGKSNRMQSQLAKEFLQVATHKGEPRYKTSGILKFTRLLAAMIISTRLSLPMVKVLAEL